MESSLNIQKIVKPSFAVIGIEGSTDDGEGFIPMLWSDANAHFDEVSPARYSPRVKCSVHGRNERVSSLIAPQMPSSAPFSSRLATGETSSKWALASDQSMGMKPSPSSVEP